jgi:hypothetical protein
MQVSGRLRGLATLPSGQNYLVPHFMTRWMGPTAGLDVMETGNFSYRCRKSNSDHSVAIQSCPSSWKISHYQRVSDYG